MAEKSLDEQIAEYEDTIEKLKVERDKLKIKASFQEYPKHVTVPAPSAELSAPTHTIVVNSAAEEAAVTGRKSGKAEKK